MLTSTTIIICIIIYILSKKTGYFQANLNHNYQNASLNDSVKENENEEGESSASRLMFLALWALFFPYFALFFRPKAPIAPLPEIGEVPPLELDEDSLDADLFFLLMYEIASTIYEISVRLLIILLIIIISSKFNKKGSLYYVSFFAFWVLLLRLFELVAPKAPLPEIGKEPLLVLDEDPPERLVDAWLQVIDKSLEYLEVEVGLDNRIFYFLGVILIFRYFSKN